MAIAKLKWHNELVMYVDKQIGEGDGSIGYDLFEDKVIEMDYDKHLMIIHDAPFDRMRTAVQGIQNLECVKAPPMLLWVLS